MRRVAAAPRGSDCEPADGDHRDAVGGDAGCVGQAGRVRCALAPAPAIRMLGACEIAAMLSVALALIGIIAVEASAAAAGPPSGRPLQLGLPRRRPHLRAFKKRCSAPG